MKKILFCGLALFLVSAADREEGLRCKLSECRGAWELRHPCLHGDG